MHPRIAHIAVALLILATSVPASRATTCGGGDPRDQLKYADGAFVGVLIGRVEGEDPSGELYADLTFDVEETMKGSLSDPVEVKDAAREIEIDVGTRVGLLLFGEPGSWRSNLCALIDPEILREAATPLPEPNGSGEPKFVVGGSYGDARLLVLDRQGRTLAYGYNDHVAVEISPCPGNEVFLELWSKVHALWLTARDAQTAEVLWERRVWHRDPLSTEDVDERFVYCEDGDGDSALLAFGDERTWSLRRVGDETSRELLSGTGILRGLTPRRVLVAQGSDLDRLSVFDISTGVGDLVAEFAREIENVAVHRGSIAITLSPRNRRPARLVLVRGDERLSRRLSGQRLDSLMAWTGDGHLALTPNRNARDPYLLFLDSGLDTIRRVGDWWAVDMSGWRHGVIGVRDGFIRTATTSGNGLEWERFILTPETYVAASLS